MEFTKETKHGKHHIVVKDDTVTIIRLGKCIKYSYSIDKNIGFTKALNKINNVCNFDSEVLIELGGLEVVE